MDSILNNIKERALNSKKKILFYETEDQRILKAASELSELGIKIVLVGGREKILNNFKLFDIDFNEKLSEKIFFIEINNNFVSKLSKELYELRKHKGLTLEQATELVQQREYFSVMLVKQGYADALIAGSMTATGRVLKPALQVLRFGGKIVSSFFTMIFEDKILLFADCAMNIYPDAEQLANIAINTSEYCYMFDMIPKVAMLSFSTKGSSYHTSVEKVREATAIVKRKKPSLIVDGELQADVAIVEHVARIKLVNRPNDKANDENLVMGDANVLIFPDLNSGNIAHKLVHRLSNCRSVGPIITGLKKPVNDLSRGCSVQEIVDLAMITLLQCR